MLEHYRAYDRDRKHDDKINDEVAETLKTEKSRVRKIAQRLKVKLPSNENIFTDVLLHMVRSEARFQEAKKSSVNLTRMELNLTVEKVQEVNKTLRVLRTLYEQRRFAEQNTLAASLRLEIGSVKDIAAYAGSTKGYVRRLVFPPKKKQTHKATQRFEAKKAEFHRFLDQDSISFALPGKRYAGKRFLHDTWQSVAEKYEQQPEFHTHGKIAPSTMRSKAYKPPHLKMFAQIPYNQCLCSYCCNFDLIRTSLIAAGAKGIPSNKYKAVHATLCADRVRQKPTNHLFPRKKCLQRECDFCSLNDVMKDLIRQNEELVSSEKTVEWWVWREGKRTDGKPLKIMKCGTFKEALEHYMAHLKTMPMHLFRADWHRNLLGILKSGMKSSYVMQVSDYAKNFTIRYQDEIQSAFFQCSSVTIIATVNYYRCPNEDCNQLVTDVIVHISDDNKHDSFLTRAAQQQSLRYLVEKGILTDHVIQFSDNCAGEFKSKRNFAEIARLLFNITRIFLGEKHAKNICDAIFGKVKSWMEKRIKSRHSIIRDPLDFYEACKKYYPGQLNESEVGDGKCHHHINTFLFLPKRESRRHHDCDLGRRVEGTQKLYAVQNTPEILKLRTRKIPCVCEACIERKGKCINSEFTDEWMERDLVPVEGDNLRKHEKRKNLKPNLSKCTETSVECTMEPESEGSDEEVEDTGYEDVEVVEEFEAEVEPELLTLDETTTENQVLSSIEVSSTEYQIVARQIQEENENFFERS